MAHPLVNQQAESATLPAAPDTDLLRSQVNERVLAINAALASLEKRRVWLAKVWRDDAGEDAVPIFVSASEVVPCRPAGADMVAHTAATQQALLIEVDALYELLEALAQYDAGGRGLMMEITTSAKRGLPGARRSSRRQRGG